MVVYARHRALLAEQKVRLRSKKAGVEEVREEFERLCKLHGANWTEVARGLREFYATFEEDDPRLPLARYKKVDERGPYRTDRDPSWPGGGGPRYDVPHPVTGNPCKVPSRGWVWPTYERMKEEIGKGNIIFGADETTIPGVRTTLFESDDQVMRSVIFSYAQKLPAKTSLNFSMARRYSTTRRATSIWNGWWITCRSRANWFWISSRVRAQRGTLSCSQTDHPKSCGNLSPCNFLNSSIQLIRTRK